jgi:hypothetical protein
MVLLTQHAVKMEPDSNFVAIEVLVVVTLAWCSVIRSASESAKDARVQLV